MRLILVPATMEIIGRWNWWLPNWLDRLLPHSGFEASEPRGPRGPALPDRVAEEVR